MEKITESQMVIIRTFLPLFVVIILFVTVGQFGFGKISDLRAQIDTAQSNQTILTQKLGILKNISATGQLSANYASFALPDSNSSLAVMAQLKSLAGANSLTLSQLKAGAASTDPNGFSTSTISFDVVGTKSQIETLINSIPSFAPISVVDKIKMSQAGPDSFLATVSVKDFWAAYPTTIPSVDSSISDLTPVETQTLQTISSLTQPQFTQLEAAQGGKADPFSP